MDECIYEDCYHKMNTLGHKMKGYGDSNEIYKFKNETWIRVGQTLYGRMLHGVSVIDYDVIQTSCDIPGSKNYIS